MSRVPACLVAAAGLLALGARPTPLPPLSPLAPAWKTLLGEFVEPPLATDSRRVYVATRDGLVRALSATTGEVIWKAEGLSGRLSAAEGALLVRQGGRLTSLQPRTGAVRWAVDTGVTGTLPAVLDERAALVAGGGLAAVDLGDGHTLWSQRGDADVSAPPVVVGARLLIGEQDGTLRARDRATGVSLWTLRTTRPLLAPPLVDSPGTLFEVLPQRRRVYVPSTDKRILAARLVDGGREWQWTVGAAITDAGAWLPDRILFAAHDAVLYALRRGGNLIWRAPLPSRPLSGPLLVSGHVLVACVENQIVDFRLDTGERVGATTTSAEIRSAPVVVRSHLVLALRDRSLVAYALPETAGSSPPASASESPAVAGADSGQ